ncbi:MAG: phenylalanine--tRNA ligase subunit alpha [Chloroflexi bacterium]|jgi:phenylalanyl-tRNA synthetase alpha chain|nr:phenylalanine--tRNA ligase subunit alpha [Chloroflexota bacterium]
MLKRLDELEREGQRELAEARDEEALQAWKVKYLGRSAELGRVLDGLRSVSKEERPALGKRSNEVKRAFETALEARLGSLASARLEHELQRERIDVTLPGRPLFRGRLHPATQTLRQILAIWAEMGFQVYRSRDVETDAYNFELLNMPAHHPARDMWDTFYTTTPGVVLRTHTSPGQIHVMRERAPEPIRVVLPGMCYRYEQVTARAEIQFNQIEGLAVGRNITFGDLKGTLTAFARRYFGHDVRTRFRAAHFPFTEPSAEMDIECFVCSGTGCPVCKHTGWLEILGSGMVHPTVLANGGYDPEEFSGFAFGMGSERISMLKHRIEDIRAFWANDLRFLEQF